MSKISVSLMVLFVVCHLALPASTGATPLSESETGAGSAQDSVKPSREGPAGISVTPELMISDPYKAAERTPSGPTSAFDVGAIEFTPQVEGSLIGLSTGSRDHEDLLRDIYVSAPDLRAIDEPGRSPISSRGTDDRPGVIKWIYSILDAAGIIDDCEGASCKKRVANR